MASYAEIEYKDELDEKEYLTIPEAIAYMREKRGMDIPPTTMQRWVSNGLLERKPPETRDGVIVGGRQQRRRILIERTQLDTFERPQVGRPKEDWPQLNDYVRLDQDAYGVGLQAVLGQVVEVENGSGADPTFVIVLANGSEIRRKADALRKPYTPYDTERAKAWMPRVLAERAKQKGA